MRTKLIRNLRKGDVILLGDATRAKYRVVRARVTHVQETSTGPFSNRRRWRAYFEILSVTPEGWSSWQSGFPFVEGYSTDRIEVTT